MGSLVLELLRDKDADSQRFLQDAGSGVMDPTHTSVFRSLED